MFKKFRLIAGKLILVVLGMIIWQSADVREVLLRHFRSATAWVATDGSGSLKHYGLQLEQNLERLEQARTGLDAQRQDLMIRESDRMEELARLDHLLACFRAACLTGMSDKFPQKVFTRSYSEEQIRTTVQDLLNRHNELQRAGQFPVHKLTNAVDQLEQRIADTKRHLENMPVYEALAVAGNAAGRASSIEESLTSCLNANQSLLADSQRLPAGSNGTPTEGREVLTAVANLSKASSRLPMSAEDFLKPAEGELKATSEQVSPPTVSELQQALRNMVLQSRDASL